MRHRTKLKLFLINLVTHWTIFLTTADKTKLQAEYSWSIDNDDYDSDYDDGNVIKNVQQDSNLQTTSTTGQPQASTTTSAIVATTQSLGLLECTNRCQTTNEYNPVCGSDRLSYSNIARLNCAINCGKVKLCDRLSKRELIVFFFLQM
jgi:hypothetical protein